jgi:hypothetical protein
MALTPQKGFIIMERILNFVEAGTGQYICFFQASHVNNAAFKTLQGRRLSVLFPIKPVYNIQDLPQVPVLVFISVNYVTDKRFCVRSHVEAYASLFTN